MKRFALVLAVPAIVGIMHLAGASSAPNTAFSEHPTPQSLGLSMPADPIAVRQAANVTYTGGGPYTAPTLDPTLNVDPNCCTYTGPATASSSPASGTVRHHAAYCVQQRFYAAHVVAAHIVKTHITKAGTYIAQHTVASHIVAAHWRKAYCVAAR